jgi:hypothetical protein
MPMRWFWIDRYEEFVRCKRAVAIKTVTLSEIPNEKLRPRHPLVATPRTGMSW